MKLIQYIEPSNPNHQAAYYQDGRTFHVDDGDVMILIDELNTGWQAMSKYGMCTIWNLSFNYKLQAYM